MPKRLPLISEICTALFEDPLVFPVTTVPHVILSCIFVGIIFVVCVVADVVPVVDIVEETLVKSVLVSELVTDDVIDDDTVDVILEDTLVLTVDEPVDVNVVVGLVNSHKLYDWNTSMA